MRKQFLISLVSVMITSGASLNTAVQAQDKLSVTSDHRPTAAMAACLSSLTRDCALKSAMQTVISEDLGIERAKVLAAVGEALIEIGDNQQAIAMLDTALEEAQSSSMTIVTQMALKDLIPLYARAGHAELAFSLFEEIQYPSTSARVGRVLADYYLTDFQSDHFDRILTRLNDPFLTRFLKLERFAVSGQTATADQLQAFQEMAKAAGSFETAVRQKGHLASIQARSGDMASAQAFWSELDSYQIGQQPPRSKAVAAIVKYLSLRHAGIEGEQTELAFMRAHTTSQRLNSADSQQIAAKWLGPIEATKGYLDTALERAAAFENMSERLAYLQRISEAVGQPYQAFTEALLAELETIKDVDGAYDRDMYRYQVLRVALPLKDMALIQGVVTAMEDDDNQARGLALMAPMLS